MALHSSLLEGLIELRKWLSTTLNYTPDERCKSDSIEGTLEPSRRGRKSDVL